MPARSARRRDQRGIVFPSPVMVLSIVAVAMAGVAWFATRGHDSPAPEATPSAQHSPSASATTHPAQHHSKPPAKHRPKPPAVNRSQVLVAVFNNTHETGLAGRVSARAAQLGWQVVGADDWYGTIPASTVYFPPQLARAGHQLALDLGIHRVLPSVSPMRTDRLTVILTGPVAGVS